MTEFSEWRDRIEAAYVPAPRTYQDAYKTYLQGAGSGKKVDTGASFQQGWMMACDALANSLVEWLDDPAGDDVAAFLEFVAELRKGDLS